MYPATTSPDLLSLCKRLKKEGASGCLISGGCLPDASVPLGRFIDTMSKIKRELDLTIFVHTGIVDYARARRLKEANIDAALIDIIGSNETIHKVYRTDITINHYANSLEALSRAGLAFVPHVIVGLHDGQLKGELEALRMISKFNPSALVVIAFMPIRGTYMENIEPPLPFDIAKVITASRLMFPSVPLVLGCMRVKGKHRVETDILAVKSGVNAIAFPSQEVLNYAERSGFEVAYSSFCCAQIYVDAVT